MKNIQTSNGRNGPIFVDQAAKTAARPHQIFHHPFRIIRWIGVCCALALAICFVQPERAQAQTAQLQVRGVTNYVHGLNLGWFSSTNDSGYGHDIGYDQWYSQCTYSSVNASNWIADIKRMHCNVARVWLFENFESLLFNVNNNGQVTGIDGTFLTNLDDLVKQADDQQVALYLTFFENGMAQFFDTTAGTERVPLNHGYAVNFITNAVAMTNVVYNAMDLIIDRYKAGAVHEHTNAIFGIDLSNEGNGMLLSYTGSDGYVYKPTCDTTNHLRAWAQFAAASIHANWPGLQVTMSSWNTNYLSSSNNFYATVGGLGFDFYDFHIYATNYPVPAVPAFVHKPLLLGEYGPTLGATYYWTNTVEWKTIIGNYLGKAAAQGWAGTLGWMYYEGDTGDNNQEGMVWLPGDAGNWKDPAYEILYYATNNLHWP